MFNVFNKKCDSDHCNNHNRQECLSQKKSAFDCSTNLPVEIMAFPDFPFSKDMPSFVKHTVVHKYLEDYADHFQLRDHIKVGNDM